MVKDKTTRRGPRITRRGLLIGTGGLGALVVGGYFGWKAARPSVIGRIADLDGGFGSSTVPTDLTAWFEIKPDNTVTFYAPKYEMGQGIHSALAQVAAEELAIPWERLVVRQATVQRGFVAGLMQTGGSTSMRTLFKPISIAAATMREMLRAEAALQLNVPLADMVAENGECYSRTEPKSRLSYGQIVAAKAGAWVAPKEAPALKPISAYMVVGKPLPRLDVRDKLLGKPVYAMDARVDGMLFGAIARPPRYGASMVSVDTSVAEQQKGVIKVVVDKAANFVGIVARTRSKAHDALAKLKIEWSGGTTVGDYEVSEMLTTDVGSGEVIRAASAPLSFDANSITATYDTPLAAHAHLEPLCALVDVRSDMIEAWLPTQMEQIDERAIRAVVPGKQPIVIHAMQMGGSFGRKGAQNAAAETARLSLAVGKPVHVAWTREEEMQHSMFRPPTRTLLRGSLSAERRIASLQQVTSSGDIIFPFLNFPGAEILKGALGVDFGVLAGMFLPYDIPGYEVRSNRVKLPIYTGPWRGVGLMPNVFALESFVDELAFAAKADPLEFRMQHLLSTEKGKRLRRALEDVREKSDWRTPPMPGRARGVALSESSGSVVCMVAEVSLRQTQIVVHRVTVSVDAGLVVNPDNAALQARGSVVMGLSSTLHERLNLSNGLVQQRNFDSYPLITMRETPAQIDVNFVGGGDTPMGMGEPVIGPVPAAVANAVFALSGKRLRVLPLAI